MNTIANFLLSLVSKAQRIAPPRSGAVQWIAVTTSSGATATALAAGVVGGWVVVQNNGTEAVYVLFGGASATVDAAGGSAATQGVVIPGGEERSWELEATDTHVALDVAANTTSVIVAKSGKD
jgi:hypothetical protein